MVGHWTFEEHMYLWSDQVQLMLFTKINVHACDASIQSIVKHFRLTTQYFIMQLQREDK